MALVKLITQPKAMWDRVRKENMDKHDKNAITVILECEDSDEGRDAMKRMAGRMPLVLPEAILRQHNETFREDRQEVDVSSNYRRMNSEANTAKDNPNVLFYTYQVRKQATISEELIEAMFGTNTD